MNWGALERMEGDRTLAAVNCQLNQAYSPPREEGRPRHQAKWREATLSERTGGRSHRNVSSERPPRLRRFGTGTFFFCAATPPHEEGTSRPNASAPVRGNVRSC